jgi:hypothetical protein
MFRAPGHTPPLSYMLDDLTTRDLARIAKHIGLSERTLERYRAADTAPRAVMLALFWETRWGASTIDTELFNAAQVHRSHAQSLERQEIALRARIARLETIGDFGAANGPAWQTR